MVERVADFRADETGLRRERLESRLAQIRCESLVDAGLVRADETLEAFELLTPKIARAGRAGAKETSLRLDERGEIELLIRAR